MPNENNYNSYAVQRIQQKTQNQFWAQWLRLHFFFTLILSLYIALKINPCWNSELIWIRIRKEHLAFSDPNADRTFMKELQKGKKYKTFKKFEGVQYHNLSGWFLKLLKRHETLGWNIPYLFGLWRLKRFPSLVHDFAVSGPCHKNHEKCVGFKV